MCYVIITGSSLSWFILSLIADMLIAVAIVTPKWLIGPSLMMPPALELAPSKDAFNATHPVPVPGIRYPSVGIYTRCRVMHAKGYHCGPFDLDGFATESRVYPAEWKAAMFFISLGFTVHSITVALTLATCCRQSAFGKSIHTMTGCAQVVSGITVMLALFLHPLGWSAPRVQQLCGSDAEPFYPASCTIGISLYSAAIAVLLCFVCAGISLKAESSNMRLRVKRHIEEGNRLVCIP